MKRNLVKNILTAAVVTALSIGAFVGCGAENASSDDKTTVSDEAVPATGDAEKSEELKPVVIAGTSIDENGYVNLGTVANISREQGYLEEELNKVGLTASYVGFQTAGVGANEALAAKEADIAVYGDFPAITYILSGNDAKIFAGDTTRNQLGIFATEDITSIADLKGKKVGTMYGTTAYLYLQKQLEKEGLSIDDVEVVNAAGDAASLYISGEIDAIANSPLMYWAIQLQGGAGHEIARNADDESLASYNVVIGRTEFLDANPGVEQAIVKAFKRAQEWADANESDVYDLFAKSSGFFPAEKYQEYYSYENDFHDMAPELTDAYISHLQEVAGFIAAVQGTESNIDLNDYLDFVTVE